MTFCMWQFETFKFPTTTNFKLKIEENHLYHYTFAPYFTIVPSKTLQLISPTRG